MAKTNKPRRYPLVLSVMGAVAATATAVYYRRQIDELLDLDPGYEKVSFPFELMDEVRNGATLVYWRDSSGKECYQITDALVKK